MSTPAPELPAAPVKQPINKKQLLGDIIAFFSIISAYFFISLTLHFKIFQHHLQITLNSHSTIILLYLFYTLFILTFKAAALLFTFLKRAEGQPQLSKWINNEVNSSLLIILVITSIYIFDHHFIDYFSIDQFCHLSLWLWIAQISRLFGSLLSRITTITSFDYWGKSIEVILLVGGLLESINLGIFRTF